jgi:hypothetical protein
MRPVFYQPAVARLNVVHCGGERMFGGQPVVRNECLDPSR